MQTLIDISAVEDDFFIAMLNTILACKKGAKNDLSKRKSV